MMRRVGDGAGLTSVQMNAEGDDDVGRATEHRADQEGL